MSDVSTINRNTLKTIIRPALDRKLEELSEELGIDITSANARYDANGRNGTFKLELAVKDEGGVAMTRERQDFLDLCEAHGLSKDMLDQPVTIGNYRVRIIGLKARATKNNILLEEANGSGRELVAPAAMVRKAFASENDASDNKVA